MARLFAVLLALVSFLSVAANGARAQNVLAQEMVKAAFLSRFASFVQWPAGAFADDRAPIRLCVLGDSALATVLDRNVATQSIEGRGIDVRRLSDAAETRDCHIVYATGADVEETLRAVRGLPVLTVTDAAFGSVRGMIHFAVVQDRVRFHIDDAQAAQGGLVISSRLLALAVSVRRRE